MINLDFGVLVDRPMKDVFAFVSNPNNMSQWNSAVVSLQQPRLAQWALAQNSKPLAK
jgi:hypothetical protein